MILKWNNLCYALNLEWNNLCSCSNPQFFLCLLVSPFQHVCRQSGRVFWQPDTGWRWLYRQYRVRVQLTVTPCTRTHSSVIHVYLFYTFCCAQFLTPAPKAGVIVVACAVRAAAAGSAAGINLVGVPQTKPMQWFLPNFQNISITKGSRAD